MVVLLVCENIGARPCLALQQSSYSPPETSGRRERDTMPTNTRWIRIGVLASFNLAVLCLSRPIAEVIGWGWHSFMANCLMTAPLFAVCFLAMITAHSLLIRTLTLIGCLFVTSVVESALTTIGHVHRPELSYMEGDAAELFMVLVPACLLIYLVAGFVDLSLSSQDEQRMRNRNRLSIAGLMIATAAFYAALVWKSELDLREAIAFSQDSPVDFEPNLTEIRVRNAREIAVYAPILSSLMLCGWWAGISRVRCLVLFVFAVALAAISRSSGNSPLLMGNSPVLMGAAGFSLWTTHIAVNVLAARLLQRK